MDLENIMQDTIVIQARAREKQGEAARFSLKKAYFLFHIGQSETNVAAGWHWYALRTHMAIQLYRFNVHLIVLLWFSVSWSQIEA